MTAFVTGLALIIAGGLAAAFGRRSRAGERLFQWMVLAGCASATIAALRVLRSGSTPSLALGASIPGSSWTFGIDALSAAFLVPVLVVGGLCAVYGTAYLGGQRRAQHAWLAHASFAGLLAAIALVVVARDAMVFLIAWEAMAIISYVLIVTEHADAAVRRAGLVYLVTTHAATLALFAMFAVWGDASGNLTFDALSRGWPLLAPSGATVVLVLAAIGFGVKAGIAPLHLWLPGAHAAAPSHVSALMSGIVIKTGIYGLLRIVQLVGAPPAWWGWLLLVAGIVSAVLGVVWALAQHDLKRLLAYHSVENIGIILMGCGIGVLGLAHRAPAVAVVGFAGAVLHTVNHALFKSLLFLGAGSVYRATGTRAIDELGGLARRIPITWVAFAIGSAAIIGVPPFNGFVSEWLVYQGFVAAEASGAGSLRLALLGVPALGLVGALALACFAKVAGVVFLGAARRPLAVDNVDRVPGFTIPMLVLAAACIALGAAPALGIWYVTPAAVALGGAAGEATLRAAASGAAGITVVAVSVVAVAATLWLGRGVLLKSRRVRYEPTWGCGYEPTTPRMQYTASSFAAPLLALFGGASGLRSERTASGFETHPRDLVLDVLAVPLWHAIHRAALRLRPIQQGRLSLYLIYVMAALLGLLVYLAAAIRR
jgi:formate hydrogenlyase subunit 3/multisubunit Na+/H+ antiporter MnhD subunit